MNADLVRRYRAFRAMGLTATASIFDARAEQRIAQGYPCGEPEKLKSNRRSRQ